MKKNYIIDLEIYPKSKLIEAIDDFNEVALIKFTDGIIEIEGDTEDECNEIFNEYMNYVIGLINE